jgi:hypothetical protein
MSDTQPSDLSDCPQCGEWRDGPRADCANCGYSPRPCGDPLGLCLYNGPHEGDHLVARYDRAGLSLSSRTQPDQRHEGGLA